MFIYSLRANTLKFFGVVGVAVVALVALIAFIPGYEPVVVSTGETVTSQEIRFDNIKTPEDVVAFLAQFGWQVDSKPLEEAEVTIPEEFDKVFTGYNELQKKQGLDLSKYKRKKLMRYTFSVSNYDGYNGTVYANVLVKGKRVVGGDICSADTNGFIHGFSKDVNLK